LRPSCWVGELLMVDLDCNSEQQQNWIAAVDQKCQDDNVDMEEK